MRYFGLDIIFTIIALVLAGWWSLYNYNNTAAILEGIFIVAVLAVMEISLSFDNAVINASILKNWNIFWKRLFLTFGIIIAVFGMRLFFPILIVAVTAKLSLMDVVYIALNNPQHYAERLAAYHIEVSTFGGIFLLLVFLNFFFDENKTAHWLKWIEKPFHYVSKVDNIGVFVVLAGLLLTAKILAPQEKEFSVIMSGIWGLVTYLGIQFVNGILTNNFISQNTTGITVVQSGLGGFLYLEVLDASCSFDGVIGAFAITNDVVFIMLGLAIGAMFVRSLTIWLVDKGTLTTYAYLEHGAHYAIGALAIIMLLSVRFVIPEIVTSAIGFLFILSAFITSVWRNHQQKKSSIY